MTVLEEETSDIATEPVDVAQEPMEPVDVEQNPVDVEQGPVDVEQDPVDVEQDPVDVAQGPVDVERGLEPVDVPQEESKDEEDAVVDEEAPVVNEEAPQKFPGATSIDGPGADPAEKKLEESQDPAEKKIQESQDPALKKEQPKEPKKEVNPNFKDVHETGKWGQISRTEMYSVLLVVVLVIAGVVAVVVVTTGNDDSDTKVLPAPPSEVIVAPTAAPTMLSLQEQLEDTARAIDFNEVAFPVGLNDLPPDYTSLAAYEGLQDDPTATPASRAMAWLLYSDGRKVKDESTFRWVMVSLYYSLGGENWPNQENWLSDESLCQWQGLDCDAFEVLRDLDLSKNNLVGEVPLQIAMLDTLHAIALRGNQLSGELNGLIFGTLPKLTILYLENNKFSGTVPAGLRKNEVLRKLDVCLMISGCCILLSSHCIVDSIHFLLQKHSFFSRTTLREISLWSFALPLRFLSLL